MDAAVVGSGPNGLAAGIVLAQAGVPVKVFEAAQTVGGGVRSGELTLPGFVHDICSAVHPLAVASPFFRTLPLAAHGLEWIVPQAPLAHPFDDGTAVVVERSIERTAAELGGDAGAYEELMRDLAADWPLVEAAVLGPLRWPRHPVAMARFGLRALRSASAFARGQFRAERARALLGGLAAHSMMPLDRPLTAGVGLVLGVLAHVAGWPVPRGGAQSLSDALASYLRSLGGEIATGTPVRDVDELRGACAILFDLSPKPLLRIAGHRFPASYRRKLERYRYGPGVFKMDWALAAPIPWSAPACARAGTVHLGGTLDEIADSERAAWAGEHSARPFVVLAQPSLFDPTRAPAGKHTAWGYCHVPNGSSVDMMERVEAQIERFAPGFRGLVLARSAMGPALIESHNANFVGGDIAAGAADWRQFFARPTRRLYSTPAKGIYICSASTPPGPGVHGMCGYFAAQRAIDEIL
jgi:phytoene dehydrogenase-like protein